MVIIKCFWFSQGLFSKVDIKGFFMVFSSIGDAESLLNYVSKVMKMLLKIVIVSHILKCFGFAYGLSSEDLVMNICNVFMIFLLLMNCNYSRKQF